MAKKVRRGSPIWAKTANTKPNNAWVANFAMFSISVRASRASALLDAEHILVMTPLAAAVEPEAKGSKKAAPKG